MPEPLRTPSEALSKPGVGARKAAALLLGLGSDVATEVFRMLNEADARLIAVGARDLRKAPAQLVPQTLEEFIQAMQTVGGDSMASENLLRDVAQRVLGPEAAQRAFEGVIPPAPADELLGPVAMAEPEALAMVLAREQPQTVALVLSSLPPERATQVMEFLPEAQRPQIVRRMALVESVAPEVLREVRQALATELQSLVAEGMRKLDGRTAALEILRRSPTAQQTEVLGWIEKDDPTLAVELRTRLFTFEDLRRLSDRDIQALLKEVDSGKLTMALKGAGPEVREKFLKNMSSRASALLADDLAALGPVKLSIVEEAQGALCKQTIELAEAGKITIVRATDKMV